MAIKNIKDVTQFNNVLNTYVSQRNSAMNNLLALSQFGIKHLQECGDLGPLQRLHDAMKKGYENRNGLARWICAYTPTVFEASKFKKDKSEAALPFNIEEALKTPFWEAFPIPDVLNIFAADEVKSAMEKIVARFQNEKKNKALNENATEAVTKLSKLIESM
jgi:hypothetical protein|tara:strand:+ start:293 stop:778 length:486 start_codon:yes stop_codon:yes gene_type:complete